MRQISNEEVHPRYENKKRPKGENSYHGALPPDIGGKFQGLRVCFKILCSVVKLYLLESLKAFGKREC